MRLWLVNPEILCKNHLLGEHKEAHMFAGALAKHKNLAGYLVNNCFEPTSLISRHNELVKEMKRRGYKHHTPLKKIDLTELTKDEMQILIDKEASLMDLISRCPHCAKNYVFSCIEQFSKMYLKFIPFDNTLLVKFPVALESAKRVPIEGSSALTLLLFDKLLDMHKPCIS